MHTRSDFYPSNSTATIPRCSNRRRIPNIVEPEIHTIEEIFPMADRTIEELLQAPTEGYGEAIVILEILAENFEIKTNLLQLVQANKFHGFERDNPYTHISNFKRMTATVKYRDVPNDAIKLMLFPYSLEGAARIWYEKEPPNLILTWDDLDSLNAAAGGNLFSKTTREALKIIENKSKVHYSRSKSNVSRVNTNSRDNVSETNDRIDKLADKISNLVEIVNKQVITPASAKAIEKTCVIFGGTHAYYDCIATDSNQPSVCAAIGSYNQVTPPNRASYQKPPPGFATVQNNPKRFNQNQGQGNNFNRGNNFQNDQGYRAQMNNVPNFQNQGFQNQPFQVPNNQFQPDIPNEEENLRRNLNDDMRSILGCFFQNHASTSGTLPSNIMPNSEGEIKVVTTHSGLAYEGPPISINSPFEKIVEQDTEETTDEEHSFQFKEYLESSFHTISPVLSIEEPEYSLSMGYKHLNTTPEMKSDEIIKSGVEELVPIPKECEVTSEDKRECDVPVCENSPIFDDHSEILSYSNNDDFSSDDDAFEDTEYVEASPLDPELVSLEEENVDEEEFNLEDIQDIILHEKLLSINRLIANIKSLNDNRTPNYMLKSSCSIPIFEESDNSLSLLDNSSPEFETFCDHTEETRSGNTTTHADNSLPEYNLFCFEIEPDQERLTRVVKNDISDDSTNDPLLEEVDLFLALDNSIPSGIENFGYDSEGDIRFLEELLIDDSIPFPNNESFDFEDNPLFP
nr:reverse transcriptase domain-containing protein [Tanacetum cinerariifolium]GEX32369.1 reverse transcriptase domain-containing protein [Tanacetum cinerariifolium]